MSRNTADTNRHKGGPGSSQQNADKPETHHTKEHKPAPASRPTRTAAVFLAAAAKATDTIPMTLPPRADLSRFRLTDST